MSMPTHGLQTYRCIKTVQAGEIIKVLPGGCYVKEADGATTFLRSYTPNMTARYTPVAGDFWVVYEDGYQSISPRAAFEAGYVLLNASPS